MTRARRRRAERWRRWIERLVFAWPIAAGLALVIVGLSVGSLDAASLADRATSLLGRPLVLGAGLLAVLLLGPAWNLALATAIYRDAAAIESADDGWEPHGAAHAATTMALPPAAVHYLHRRYRHIGTPAGRAPWWLAFPLAVVGALAPILAVRAGAVPPSTVLAGQGLALSILPVAAYRDAARLGRAGSPWRPNPATHLVAATVAGLTLLPLPIYAGYYLLRRTAA